MTKYFNHDFDIFMISYTFLLRFGLVNCLFKGNFMIFKMDKNLSRSDGRIFGQIFDQSRLGLVNIGQT